MSVLCKVLTYEDGRPMLTAYSEPTSAADHSIVTEVLSPESSLELAKNLARNIGKLLDRINRVPLCHNYGLDMFGLLDSIEEEYFEYRDEYSFDDYCEDLLWDEYDAQTKVYTQCKSWRRQRKQSPNGHRPRL